VAASLSAELYNPLSIAFDLAGDLYIGEGGVVWRVDAVTQIITTVAGGYYPPAGDGDGGPALTANINSPYSLATDASGSIYIADDGNNRIRFVDFVSPQIALASSLVSVSASAGSGSTAFTINPSSAIWSATSSAGWLTLTAASGTGSGSVAYSYTANNSVASRDAAISIGGEVLQVIQAGSVVALSASSAQAPPAGGTGTFGLTVSPSVPWTAVSSASWLTVAPPGGSSNATLTWTAAANTGTDARSATILAGGKIFTVLQLSGTGVYTPWAGTANGQIRTIAGGGTGGDNIAAIQSLLTTPGGIALNANSNLFIADTGANKIRRVDAVTGIITTVAGTGTAGFGGDGAVATSAMLKGPQGIAVVGQLIYVTDTGNNRIRMIDGSGNITTIAGNGAASSSGDGGPAVAAGLNAPRGIAADTRGNLFFADNGSQRIRRIDAATGTIITVAGTGVAGYAGDGGPATAALLSNPLGVAVDSAGDLFIADTANYRIRRVDAVTGMITTVAGGGNNCCNGSGDNGPAVNASLSSPAGVAIDPAGNLIIADTGDGRVRRVDATGTIETIAGTGGCCSGSVGDGGPALLAGLSPTGVVADGIGNLYVIDGSRVRFIDFTTPSVTLPAPNIAATQAAGTGSINMTILPSGAFWGAVSSASWLTVTTPSGTGNATIGYSFSLNNSVVPRTATITIAGRVLIVTQAGAKSSLPAYSTTVGSVAGSGTLSLTLTAAVPWTATSSATWLTVASPSGSGSTTLTYNFTANTGTAARIAAITVAGQSFSVLQGGTTQVFSIRNGDGRATIQTIAGNGQYGPSGDGGPAASAGITPGKSVIDANGNVFVIDSNNERVRRIDVVTGVISTVAGNATNTFAGDGGLATSASLSNPRGVALDGSGNLFIADTGNYRIRRVDALTGIITTVAGAGAGSYGGDGGLATSAQLSSPVDVAVDGNGALFIADNGDYRILRVDPVTGVITTVAGNGTNGSTGNGGLATQAELVPTSISLDAAGDIFLVDQGSYVRMISAVTGNISTVAGSVGGSTQATTTNFFQLSGIAADPVGNFYLINASLVYRVDGVTGLVTTVAGEPNNYSSASSGDGGPAILADLNSPQRISLDGAGNVYISENYRLRYVDYSTPLAVVTPQTAETGAAAGSGQVTIAVSPANIPWSAVSSVPWLNITSPSGTGAGTLSYSFTSNNTFAPRTGLITLFGQSLVVTQTGVSASVSPAAVTVSSAGGSGTFSLTTGSSVPWMASGSASWLIPTQLSGNGSTTINYSFSTNTSTVPRTASITAAGQTFTVLQLGNTDQYSVWGTGGNGIIVTVAGNGVNGYSGDGGPAVNANLSTVNGVAVDANNRVYIADTSNNRIRAFDPVTGDINTVAGVGTAGFSGDGEQAMASKLSAPGGIAVDASGNLYVADTGNNRIRRIDAVSGLISTVAGSGTAGYSGDGGLATMANLSAPGGLALDAFDNIYVADTGNNAIRRVDAATGTIDTIAGTGFSGFSGDNGPALQAQLAQPYGLAVDSAGDVLIADSQNFRVRRVNAATGVITTVVGTGNSGFTGDGGLGTAADLSAVLGVALDAAGDLYIADTNNSRLRRVDAGTGIITTVAGTGACCTSGGDGGPAILASVEGPRAVAVSASGIYIADSTSRIRFVDLASPAVTVSASVVSIGNAGGTGSVNVSVSPAGSVWVASSNASWLILTSSGGNGNGSIAFTCAANNSILSRTATITIYGTQITVIQAGAIATLSPASTIVGSAAGAFSVTMTLSAQVPWTAISSATWLTPNFASGTGNAVISWTYSANTSQNARIATLLIAGKLFAVTQAGSASYTPWGTFGNGIIATIVGGGGNQATLSTPYSVAVDGNGDLFIGEFGYILRVDAVTGAKTTVAGSGVYFGSSGDGGPATSASLTYPYGLALDISGNLYFSDNYDNEVRRVDAATGIITKVAGGSSSGTSGDGGPATAVTLNTPRGVALDNKGTLYIAEFTRVRAVNLATGIISTYAGSATSGFAGDGGPASQALLNGIGSIALDSAGNLFIYDYGNYRIRRVDVTTQNISTVAGTGCCGNFSGDGGPAVQASISGTGTGASLAVDAAGNLYIADYSNYRIRRVNALSGIITTIAGTGGNASAGDGGLATAASLASPGSIALDASGNVYFLESTSRVRFIDYSTPLAPIPQTITFGPLSNVGLIPPFTISATASSALAVSFVSTTASVCAVSGSTVTVLGAGVCSITAGQGGNVTYAAAAPVTRSFTVTSSPVYQLTVAVSPSNSGTVTASPASLNNYYASGSVVCLTASPAAGHTFTGWTGAALNAAGCLTMTASASVTANFQVNPISATSARRFIPVVPCRLVDTRNPAGPLGGPSIAAGGTRRFTIPGTCNIPSTALAYSLNLTVVPQVTLGYVSVWPAGQTQPVVSTLNSLDGRVKSNAAIVSAGTGGAVNVFATDSTDVILDINGYFDSYTDSSALQFYPLTPCRVADTRNSAGSLGAPSLRASEARSFPIVSSACGIPGNAQAYSLNFTAIPQGPLGYLTVWPNGQSQPLVSTLNAPTGAVTANAGIVQAGTGGAIELFATNDTDIAIDINGYFAAPASGGLSLYNLTPCRIEDTRLPAGTPAFTGTATETATGVACGVPPEARSLVLNATVVPSGVLGYLSLWANGGSQPVVSTLNALDGSVTSNMAVVPATNGLVNAYAAGPGATYLILDISGYFAP
jgi:sugar lactone lactonase YvrE